MQMAGSGSQVNPWAQRANEPLVPSVDLPAVKKAVQADLKEMRRFTEALKALAKKKGSPRQQVEQALLEISTAAREHARRASGMLREALSIAVEGSNEHKVVSALSEEFRQTLLKFQQQVEAVGGAGDPAPAAPAASATPSQLEMGYGQGGGGASGGLGSSDAGPFGGQQQQLQQQIDTNENVLREREVGIGQLNRSVQEVAEIFQDLALLVNEQGAQIDNIETNIETAAGNTERGVRELARASNYQRRARGRMCIIGACVLVLLIILILVLKFGLRRL